MSKAKVKKVEEMGKMPEGMQAKDLSVEKRFELYQKALTEFDAEATKLYGVSISVELNFTKQGIKPVMILVDMLKAQADESKNTEAPKKE